MEIEALFSSGLTPSLAYNEFLRNMQSNPKDELTFILKKLTGPSVQEEETLLYIKYCHEKFGGRNGAEMFDKLEGIINDFMESNEGAKITHQLYNEDQNLALILAIMTPLMKRVNWYW